MTRCPFSLSRLVRVTETGQVVYKAEKDACRAFPSTQGDGLARGPNRNFQILDPLDFLAEFTQHIPPKGSHLIRYYGWYSNKTRGMRKKVIAEAAASEDAADTSSPDAAGGATASRCSKTWAMLIKRVYEVDPLCCPHCGGRMKVVSFIDPPQRKVIEKILDHCGLLRPLAARAPPDQAPVDAPQADLSDPAELTCVDIDTFLATFRLCADGRSGT